MDSSVSIAYMSHKANKGLRLREAEEIVGYFEYIILDEQDSTQSFLFGAGDNTVLYTRRKLDKKVPLCLDHHRQEERSV